MNAFTEKQRFTQWWIWVILLLPPLFILGGIALESPAMEGVNTDSVGFILVVLLLSVALLGVKLETRIDSTGISARLFPFHWTYRTFHWSALASVQVRKYQPIREFGGWGYRSWGGKKGNAWNISGNKGIQLKFISGRELLIGTQKPEEIEKYLTKLATDFPDLDIPLLEGNK
jgi:hypothetical protein